MGKEISRRALFAGSASLVAGALLAPALSGCGTGNDTPSVNASASDASGEVRTYPTHVHNTDILVIGSGLAGCTAAMRAMQLGSTVAIVDKGQFGHSGNSGMNWGHMIGMEAAKGEDLEAKIANGIKMGYGVNDQNIISTLTYAAQDMQKTLLVESLGSVSERLEDGSPGCTFYGNPVSTTTAGFFPRFVSQKAKKMGAEVFERTLLLDVLVNDDGELSGGIALDLKSGEMHVFRAKAVIMGMGGYNWMCGWTGLRPDSMASPDNTGDGPAILMKHGVPVSNLEFISCDYNTWNPGCIRNTMGIGMEIPNYHRALDIDGNHFIYDYMREHPEENCIGMITNLVAGELYRGRGSENGGVWLDVSNFEGQELELFYRRCAENYKKHFDYTMPDVVEVVPDFWESFFMTKVDETMQTKIPGLYFTRYATNFGGSVDNLMAMAQISAENAANRAASIDFPAVDWDQVNEVLNHTYELLERDPEDGIPARQVMRNIQLAYGEGLKLLRDEEGIQATLDEFKRIREEDLPRMCVPDKTRVMNTEWRQALETEFMIITAIGVAMAALERRESRWQHIRTDYPVINNDEYMKRFAISMDGDEFKLEEEEVDTSIINASELAPKINATNIYSIHGA